MKEKLKCRWCGKEGMIKFYIIADDMENPKPYHPACLRKLEVEVMKKLSDNFSGINKRLALTKFCNKPSL